MNSSHEKKKRIVFWEKKKINKWVPFNSIITKILSLDYSYVSFLWNSSDRLTLSCYLKDTNKSNLLTNAKHTNINCSLKFQVRGRWFPYCTRLFGCINHKQISWYRQLRWVCADISRHNAEGALFFLIKNSSDTFCVTLSQRMFSKCLLWGAWSSAP